MTFPHPQLTTIVINDMRLSYHLWGTINTDDVKNSLLCIKTQPMIITCTFIVDITISW